MVQKIRVRRVLEIGTGDGTSTLAMAEMLPNDSTVLTRKINAGFAMAPASAWGETHTAERSGCS